MSANQSAEEIERLWPEAVAVAREYRAVFGPEVRLVHARNAAGDELRRRGYVPQKPPKGPI